MVGRSQYIWTAHVTDFKGNVTVFEEKTSVALAKAIGVSSSTVVKRHQHPEDATVHRNIIVTRRPDLGRTRGPPNRRRFCTKCCADLFDQPTEQPAVTEESEPAGE